MFKHLNPWYMEEARASSLPKFGDPWEAHAKVKNVDHHGRQADKHGEAEDYHNHAMNALDDYIHNPFETPEKNQSIGAMKELKKHHAAKMKYHNSMYHKHSKAAEEKDYYPGKPRSKGDKAEFVTPPSKK